MEERFDLIVIGSGPGGYVAAIKAAKLGMKTAIIESREIGGTCLNRGCIPTKTLMHSSHLYYELSQLSELGITVDGIRMDYDRLRSRKNEVVTKIRQGIVNLLESHRVTIIHGKAKLMREGRVVVSAVKDSGNQGSDQTTSTKLSEQAGSLLELIGDKILIATGSQPVIPGIEGSNLKNVITSDELLELEKVYSKLLIIGGGVIGIEFATMYRELGCQVEIIEAMDRILPGMDKEISQSVAMSLKKKGVIIHTKARVNRITETEEGVLSCEYTEKDSAMTASAEAVLLSIGRKPNTKGLFAEHLMPEMDGAYIKVTEEFETSIKGVYAIGDVIKRYSSATGNPIRSSNVQLAHAASAQGIAAVEGMTGRALSVNLEVIPSCVYTTPEIAVVGLTEEEALEAGYQVKVGKYPMLGNSKTVLSSGERGFIKVICDKATDRILGAVLLCDRATDLVSEFATAIANGLTAHDMATVIRPHPTYSEGITEAIEDIEGMAIHLMPKRI